MKVFGLMKKSVLTIAIMGLVLPWRPILAAGSQSRTSGKLASPRSLIHDVALGEAGVLQGRVVDAQGLPLADAPVSILQGERVVAESATGINGEFVVRGLKGGVYTVAAGRSQEAVRLWAVNTAPPVAEEGLLIVSGSPVVRGQGSGWPDFNQSTMVTLGVLGVVTAAILIPVGIDGQEGESRTNILPPASP